MEERASNLCGIFILHDFYSICNRNLSRSCFFFGNSGIKKTWLVVPLSVLSWQTFNRTLNQTTIWINRVLEVFGKFCQGSQISIAASWFSSHQLQQRDNFKVIYIALYSEWNTSIYLRGCPTLVFHWKLKNLLNIPYKTTTSFAFFPLHSVVLCTNLHLSRAHR